MEKAFDTRWLAEADICLPAPLLPLLKRVAMTGRYDGWRALSIPWSRGIPLTMAKQVDEVAVMGLSWLLAGAVKNYADSIIKLKACPAGQAFLIGGLSPAADGYPADDHITDLDLC